MSREQNEVQTIGATRCYGDEWFRELTIKGITFLAPLDQQEDARVLLGMALDADAARRAALTASPQAAPEVELVPGLWVRPGAVICGDHKYECFYYAATGAFPVYRLASPQAQGAEAVGEITGTYDGKGMALVDLDRCPIGTKLYATPQRAPGVDEAMVERAMRARIPGGSEAWVWLFNCEGGIAPEEKHRDWFRRVLTAALTSARVSDEIVERAVNAYFSAGNEGFSPAYRQMADDEGPEWEAATKACMRAALEAALASGPSGVDGG